jgi:hypothetical protein
MESTPGGNAIKQNKIRTQLTYNLRPLPNLPNIESHIPIVNYLAMQKMVRINHLLR